MQILLNKNGLIVGYAEVGGFDNGVEISESILPDTFKTEFKSNKFKYVDGVIFYNKDFIDGQANEKLKIENVSLEDKVKFLEDKVRELEDIIANNQVTE